MPTNKKESLIFTFMMCFFMVFVMSVYNVSRHMGFGMEAIQAAWMGFPIAYIFAMLCDWFVVSRFAKAAAFKIVSFDSPALHKIIAVSSCMVIGMVLLMSLYGAVEMNGIGTQTLRAWLINIPFNFIAALPLQLLIAGPIVRKVFRTLFPIGSIVDNA